MYIKYIKYIIDLLISTLILVIFSPLILIVTICLFFSNKEVFFIQERPGKNGKLFSIIKFKTMNDKKGFNGELLPDNERLFLFGKIVRKLSIDELPQLINVIKGDMSIVGPRPLLKEYLSIYNTEQFKRHDVKPGITGWAQVNGRNSISWKKKFDLDIWYVDNISLLLDIKIILLTIKKVLIADNINIDHNNTMTKFTGNE
jgi:undecaprenyl phosphate N,N'-diacetylbacillosamine 1-phosphate transferase